MFTSQSVPTTESHLLYNVTGNCPTCWGHQISLLTLESRQAGTLVRGSALLVTLASILTRRGVTRDVHTFTQCPYVCDMIGDDQLPSMRQDVSWEVWVYLRRSTNLWNHLGIDIHRILASWYKCPHSDSWHHCIRWYLSCMSNQCIQDCIYKSSLQQRKRWYHLKYPHGWP